MKINTFKEGREILKFEVQINSLSVLSVERHK